MAITTDLLVARHGEATCNTTGIVGGERGCTGLTDHGRQQAHQLAARLGTEHASPPGYGLSGLTSRMHSSPATAASLIWTTRSSSTAATSTS